MKGQNGNHYFSTKKLCFVALFTAINVVLSSFSVPVPGGHLYLNDVIITFSALIFDPVSAFIVGGVGAFLGDFFFYPTPMFVSLVVRSIQAIAISVIVGNLFNKNSNDNVFLHIIALIVGIIIMVVGYTIGRAYFYGTPDQAVIKLPYQILQAVVGAVLGYLLFRNKQIKNLIKEIPKK